MSEVVGSDGGKVVLAAGTPRRPTRQQIAAAALYLCATGPDRRLRDPETNELGYLRPSAGKRDLTEAIEQALGSRGAPLAIKRTLEGLDGDGRRLLAAGWLARRSGLPR